MRVLEMARPVLAIIIVIVFAMQGVNCSAEAYEIGESGEIMQLADTELFFADCSGEDLYYYGISEIVCSTDSGATWSEPYELNGRVCADGSHLYRLNMTDNDGYSSEIFFSKSDDRGHTWSQAIEVIQLEGMNDYGYGIFALGDDILAYSYDYGSSDNGSLVCAISDDGGDTWSSQLFIDDSANMIDPVPNELVYLGSKLYITYWNYTESIDDSQIIVKASEDMGATWENRQVIATGGGEPLMTTDGSSLYLTYITMEGIMFMTSDNGEQWTDPFLVGPMTDLTDSSLLHSLDAIAGNVFIAYSDYNVTDKSYEVIVKHSPDGGDTWSFISNITDPDNNCIAPAIICFEDQLHISWVDLGAGQWYNDGVTYYRNIELIPPPSSGILSNESIMLMLIVVVAASAIIIASLIVIKKRRASK